jgi:hypothetical protein
MSTAQFGVLGTAVGVVLYTLIVSGALWVRQHEA